MFGGVKRFRVAGDVEMVENMAHALVLLSQQGGAGGVGWEFSEACAPAPARVFECKTCSRKFPSFQALGGHRASHKKPKVAASEGGGEAAARPKVHECSVCGLEFSIGQALGGHMRRHRAVMTGGLAPGTVADEGERQRRKAEENRAVPWLDLNVAPASSTPEVVVEATASYRKKIFGFEIVDTTSVAVDCFR
ncbi:uncharacterized protein LOC141845623 [Curcuma longa]|uniref:uncharacterized protein LOC141845623 n=1 Tax=Curcuma longa TaxID=136217 RepID=UPI003D9EA7C0